MNTIKRTVVPVLAAVLAAAVISSIWYSPALFRESWVALRSQWLHVPPDAYIAPWKPMVELVREFVVAYALTRLVTQLRITRIASATWLGFLLWLAFPMAMLVGASMWDDKPWELSLIHGGDWLTKLLVMPIVITVTQRLTMKSRANAGMPDDAQLPAQR